jgi:hypothetical protein
MDLERIKQVADDALLNELVFRWTFIIKGSIGWVVGWVPAKHA